MHVLYVSNTQGVHDDRWVSALRSVGCIVGSLTFDPEDESARGTVASRIDGLDIDVVVAGPLTTCTESLLGIGVPLIGLSWGFDLHEMVAIGGAIDHRWLADLAGLIVDSESTLTIAAGFGVPPDRIAFIPWGVDLELFDPEGPQATHPALPAGARVVLSARAHESLYRVGDIVAAFEHGRNEWDDDVYLVVVNDGPLTEELSTTAGGHTLFIGRVSESDLAAWCRRSQVYVSASETDGSSVTLLQAMACGTPVLVSDIPGNREWIQEGITGHLFPVGDIGALGAALALSLRGEHETDFAAKALIEVRSRADWARNSSRLSALLQKVIAQPRLE